MDGQRIVFYKFKDAALKDAVESLGGKVTAAFSRLSNFIVYDPDIVHLSQDIKATIKKNNVRILTRAEFIDMIESIKHPKSPGTPSPIASTIASLSLTRPNDTSRIIVESKNRPVAKSNTRPKASTHVPVIVPIGQIQVNKGRAHASPSKPEIGIYTVDKFIKDCKSDEFIKLAIKSETECLNNKLAMYEKLNKTNWSAEMSTGQGFSTDFNKIIASMILAIKDRILHLKTRTLINSKREQLLDIATNPDVGINTIRGEARVLIREQLVKFIYMFFKAPTFFSHSFTNFMLTGSAGSGKTKIANNIAHVMSNLGLLVKDKVISATKQSLVGQYIGHSAPKTRQIFASALESVLFIDEAYTLTPCTAANSQFESESMGELINLMDKFIGCNIVIVAGYKKEMRECFLPFNQGLARRFPRVFDLTPYTSTDMWYLFDAFIDETILNMLSEKEKSVIMSFIDALNKLDVFQNQAGDIMNLAHLVTEDVLLSEHKYSVKDVAATFKRFCEMKNMSLVIG